MNIGDRVRLIHGKEEGIVRKISSSGRIEVEIEDGFIIPAMKSEAVVIHETEKAYFGDKETKEEYTPAPVSSSPKDQGIYLAFVPINDQNLSLYLINDSKQAYLAHISEVFGGNHRTLFAGNIQSGEGKKFDDRLLKEMDEWPAFLLRFIPIQDRLEKAKPAFERQLKMKPTQFFKHLSNAPILNKTAYLFSLETTTKELDIRSLNQELEQLNPKPEPLQGRQPDKSIDLHIEKLVQNHDKMSNSEILRIQLETFEKNLDQAIASGMHEITFIHGHGNGVLRKEIHKRLSQLGNIKYFQDTQKDQWGYGATLVRIY
ncbi:DUF2027 domain-containing protein [Algoriphagus sp. CAU 1675]|uniref:Smr/MutS family protein n=1 Tax=Algoriphagus sp. CAU 1675 TaxID=3032597 RepID=UPI0023D98DE6|nr:DUF2027 domain-containing protein [Algoriphagus sp. CAU 1675]MDF2157192.1 DUF2027 domain-containing protein [Algoriphagus sp. CAU 1675]